MLKKHKATTVTEQPTVVKERKQKQQERKLLLKE
jgi:hypothetical protein